MEYRTLGERYADYLNLHTLYTLRIIGRKFGVPQSTSRKKEPLIDGLVKVLTGEVAPVPPNGKGAKAKQSYVDPEILQKLEEIRASANEEIRLEVGSCQPSFSEYDLPVFCGFLEITKGEYGILHACKGKGDVFVKDSDVAKYRLRQGDKVSCHVAETEKGMRLSEVLTVNGLSIGSYEDRTAFEEVPAHYPTERVLLGGSGDDDLKTVDLFAPIGKGQRAVILSKSEEAQETLLKKITAAFANTEEFSSLAYLVGVAPEAVTEFKTDLFGVEVFSATFEETRAEQVKKAELVLNYAKRLVECGKDVFLAVNSLNALARAYESTEGNEAGALRFFGAARKIKNWGSLTIVAILKDDEEARRFLGTENCRIYCNQNGVELRSETKKEDLLLTAEERTFAQKARNADENEREKMLSDLCSSANHSALLRKYGKGK